MRIKLIVVVLCIITTACSGSYTSMATRVPEKPATPSIAALPTSTLSPTNTLLPTFTSIPTKDIPRTPSDTPTITSTPIHPVERLVIHNADQEILYNWFSYIPQGLEKDEQIYIWVTSVPTMPSDDYQAVTSQIKNGAEHLSFTARRNKYVFLTLAIPRPETNHIYVIAYNRKVFLTQTPAMYRRPDLELNKMIDRLTSILRQDGYNVADKFFMDGYSAGGMFAQRYALLHPERLMAVAGGQCGGSLTVPDMAYDWPVGIRDFKKLTGIAFNDKDYHLLPQLYYIGDLDSNNSTVHFGNSDVFSDAQVMTLFNRFGREDPERLQSQVNHMNTLGFTNVIFKLYPGIKHKLTVQMIEDTVQFFEKYR